MKRVEYDSMERRRMEGRDCDASKVRRKAGEEKR